MERSINSSKGNRNMTNFAQTPIGEGTGGKFRGELDKIQRRVADKINEVINGGTKGKDWFEGFFGGNDGI